MENEAYVAGLEDGLRVLLKLALMSELKKDNRPKIEELVKSVKNTDGDTEYISGYCDQIETYMEVIWDESERKISPDF